MIKKIQQTFEGQWSTLFTGLGNTLIIACTAVLIGITLGSVMAIIKAFKNNEPGKASRAGFVSWLVDAYLWFFRGTPVVVQLLLFYYGFLAHVGMSPLVSAMIIFGLNSAAYVTEIMRGGILSIDKGQLEAGRSLGLPFSATMKKIVLPQAFKNAIPNLCNEFIALLKETSVAGFISVIDLTKAASQVAGKTYQQIATYTVLALIYLVLVTIATFGIRKIEKRLRKSDIR